MTRQPTHQDDINADESMFDFGDRGERVTMTLDPVTHYLELAALAALLKWAERIDEYVTMDLTEDEARMYRLAVDLRRQYEQEQM